MSERGAVYDHDRTGADHLEESQRFAALGQQMYEALVEMLACGLRHDESGCVHTRQAAEAMNAWETRP